MPLSHVSARRGRSSPGWRSQEGLSFIEMIATVAILMILAAAILPLARVTIVRQRELELRRDLRQIRSAIDGYHMAAVNHQFSGLDLKVGSENYPPDLETLVKGTKVTGTVERKLKFLRRIPVDPMTGSTEWGLRCYQDDADETSWCGDNVWDVYTTSEGTALDGTKYKDW